MSDAGSDNTGFIRDELVIVDFGKLYPYEALYWGFSDDHKVMAIIRRKSDKIVCQVNINRLSKANYNKKNIIKLK